MILRDGGLLSLFPEGTRFRDPGTLGVPRRGAARLALETGAPLVPAAITGSLSGPAPPRHEPGQTEGRKSAAGARSANRAIKGSAAA